MVLGTLRYGRFVAVLDELVNRVFLSNISNMEWENGVMQVPSVVRGCAVLMCG